jgi:peptide/nickel transport system substrate-binding protein
MAIPDLKVEHKLLKNLFPRKWPGFQRLKYLPRFLSIQEKRIIKSATIVAIIAIIFLSIRLSQTSLSAPDYGGYYVEGVVGFPQYLNPILARNNDIDSDLTKLIFSGLFKYDQNLEIVPDLAKNFEISDDQLHYKIEIKDNALWHDNQKLTADDVIFTVKTIKNPQLKNPWADYFQNVNVVKINEKAVEFVLAQPNPIFLKHLTVSIMPQHLWQEVPIQQFHLSDYNVKPIGSGPFKFKSLRRDKNGLIQSYALERNENFYNRKAYLARITFKFYSKFKEPIVDIQKREINGISYVPNYLQEKFFSNGILKKYSLELPHYTAIFFNEKNNKFLESKTLRKALAYAIPKEKIINDVLARDGDVLNGPILPGAFGYNPNLKTYNFEPDKAVKILENSGWHKGDDGFWQKDGKILEISLTTAQQPDLEKIGEIVQKSWQEIGVKTKLISVPAESIKKDIIATRNYQALIYGIIESFDSDPYPLWHSSQVKYPGLNLSGFSNKRVDELLEKAQSVPFDDVRKKKYIEFQDIISEEVPVIFLYRAAYTYFVDKKIKGIEVHRINLPSDRLNGIEDWYIRMKKVKIKK